ncbi:GNAT family N-acetyltransferase [Rhodopirellula sp. JC740]|uniref:GNAT family N-acetyltransferase n=1 Tax=Rhodopirellula halodulae TaxID=2894198 RepID=A0ABS8NNL0_9BACT|nr:GNAT family N-acetyltransferase [Rhodopirellula sp. JC740]MCC9645090.1 GNAT family N-acetyltransferase [Rhodopirellula sp. JC740]
MSLNVRAMQTRDSEMVVQLNADAVAFTSPMDVDRLRVLTRLCSLCLVAEHHQTVVGFLLAMPEGVDYDNGNYCWFSQRLRHFLYVDRVVVSASARGLGVASSLYERLYREATDTGALQIAAEIDCEPANLPSLQFHERQHFVEIGKRELPSGKWVSMQLQTV